MNIKEFIKLLQPLLFEDQLSFDRPLCFLNLLVEQSGAYCGFSFYGKSELKCDARVGSKDEDGDFNFLERDFKHYKLQENSGVIHGLNRQDVFGDDFISLPCIKEFISVPWNRSKKETGNFLLGFDKAIDWAKIQKMDITDITRIYELLYSQHHKHADKLDIAFNFQTKNRNAFLATMSHEIRTPLNVIIGILELLQGEYSEEKVKHYLRIAYNNADALMGIVNNVLDFSKINSGKMNLNFEYGSFYKVLDEVVFALSEKAFSKNLELLVSYPVRFSEEVSIDPIRLRQVFNNLIGNSIKYTSEGSVQISVTPISINGKVEYQVSVKDTGAGIPIEKQTSIFKPYEQVEGNLSPENSSGLGLSITRNIIRKFGGNISVKSDGNSGSQFLFNMVLKKTSQQKNPENWMDPLAGIPIWLIDFDKVSQSFIAEILQQARCRLSVFSNFETFQDESNELQAPNFILIDGRVLFKNSAFFHSFLKQSFRLKPEILVLGKDDLASSVLTKDESISLSLIRKPILPHQLLRKILEKMIPNSESNQVLEIKSHNKSTELSLEILIAEDAEANQILFQVQMERLGHQVTFARDGKKAWELLISKNTFDLVFIDLRMPVWDGIYLIKKIRSNNSDPHLRSIYTVALTANTSEEDRNYCINSGMNAFLTKPVRINDLRKVISEYKIWLMEKNSKQLNLSL